MAGKKLRTGMLAGCGIAAVSALTPGHQASAATLYTTGFEAPTFTSGTFLTGEGGFSSAVTSDVVASKGSAVVAPYATPVAGNAQYAQLNDLSGIAATTEAFYFPTLSSITPVAAGTPTIDTVAQIAVGSGTGGATFGLAAFDGTAGGNLIADVEINSATGAVTVDGATTAVSTGYTAPTGFAYQNYELQLNFASQTYNVYEAAVGATTFTNEIAAAIPFETAATTYSTSAIDTLSTGGTGSGLAEFDNLTISAVPEPASASLILGGLVVAGGRRRRRSSAR